MDLVTTRRKFLVGGASAALGAVVARGEVSDSSLRADLRARLSAAGFDADKGDGAVLGVFADPHIFLGSEYPQYRTDKWEDRLIDELNGLWPLMTDVVVAGDLISYHSMIPGIPRFPIHDVWAREEFQLAKRELSRFDPRLRVWCVPGNHDTTADEADAELWQEMLGIPAYRKAVLGGVPVFFLNSGNGGMPGPGQLAWFRAAAAATPKDQEVVVVMHHPVFLALREEAAMKRVLCEVFGGRKGRVWIVSGHNHSFHDEPFSYHGTSFVQMEVTTAHPTAFSDSRSPGYILLALQNRRVVCRFFRSLRQDGLEERRLRGAGAGRAVQFQFDGVWPLAEAFEEGLYDRAGRVLSLLGVDVGSYLTYVKQVTFQVKPGEYRGRVGELILAGTIAAVIQPTCAISRTGLAGTWEPVGFPANRGGGLFRIPIPDRFVDGDSFQVKVETGLTGSLEGFRLSGWALAADPKSLSAYDRWLLAVHGHLRKEAATDAQAVTPGTSNANLTNFAYGLAVPGPVAGTPVVAPGAISGMPRSRRASREVLDFRFARRRAASLPGVECVVECSGDLRSWERLEAAALGVRTLDGVWEEVSVARVIAPGQLEYLRVGVVEDAGLGPGFGQWKYQVARAAVSGGNPRPRPRDHPLPKPGVARVAGMAGDVNGNGIEDLLEYAFDLGSGAGGLRSYDPGREGAWAGIPRYRARRASVSLVVFPRMKASASPGVRYTLEWSTNLKDWVPVPGWLVAERVQRSEGDWDEVEYSVIDGDLPRRFYRVRLSEE